MRPDQPHPGFTVRLRRALGTVVFIAGIAAIAAVCFPPLLGYKMMIVTSGSMSPTIDAGDAILIKRPSAENLRPGQVVTYIPIGATRPTTHRIVSLRPVKGELFLQTKGDANDTPDADLAPAASVIGRVAVRVPDASSVVGVLVSLTGRLLVIAVPVLVLFGFELRDFGRERRHLRRHLAPEAPAVTSR